MHTSLLASMVAGALVVPAAVAATADKTPPKVTAFSVPSNVNSTSVPISLLVASDDTALAAYLVTMSQTAPLPSATGWSPTPPTRFQADGSGVKTLYAWAKDKAGNLSAPVSAKVNIDTSAPKVSSFTISCSAGSQTVTVTKLTATDNTAVTGYLVSESGAPPALTGAGWQTTPPVSYKLGQAVTTNPSLYGFVRDAAGNVSQGLRADCGQSQGSGFNLAQTLSDGAQRTTLAFAGLAMVTGNLQAQTFFPPGKVADYTGFQYLRDNDPDGMGHNTSFLTRVANNVIYALSDAQFAQLKTLASAQISQINQYGLQRYPLMQAFRRTLAGDVPATSRGLNFNAVKQASRDLYLIDGQISFDRALLYANIINSLDSIQRARFDGMKGKGWKSWPDVTSDQIKTRMQELPQGTAVAVMTYASDLFSWYAGSVDADVYFCPERHGTYFGSFYIKDAPAIGHEGYSINEQLTATAGAALSDSSKGYVSAEQAALMSSLVDLQRNNLYGSSTSNIVKIRTSIATHLRGLLTSTANADAIKAQVLSLSASYGELDGANNYQYATVFAKVNNSLSATQKTKLAGLRNSILSGTYADGTPFDYSEGKSYFLYSEAITDMGLILPYLTNSDHLFFEP